MKKPLLLLTIVFMVLMSTPAFALEVEAEGAEGADVIKEEKAAISGNLIVSYSSGSGGFSAEYRGDAEVSKHGTFTWYKGGSSVSTTREYHPTTTGTYYCVLTDDSRSGELKSREITLYQAKGKSNMTFSNEYGLYEKGASVTGRAKLEKGETVTGWTTNVRGVAVPSSGNPIVFTMPAQDITITPTISKMYSIKISGGTADKYLALPDEIVTIRANKVKHETFDKWKISGGKLENEKKKTTTFKMPSSDVTIEAQYKSDSSSSSSSSTTSSSSTRTSDTVTAAPLANAVNAVYEVLSDGGYKVDVRHAMQGPLCDRAFRIAQGRDWLVTDYFNITINGSYDVYELPSPIRIRLMIPQDLQKAGRSWRMLCISRGGVAYSFPDEDSDDTSITFSPDRFYAYAMVFNDRGFETVEEPEVIKEEPEEQPEVKEEPLETSSSHNIEESQTMTSKVHSVEESATYSEGVQEVPYEIGSLNMDSDKKYAISMAHGTKIPTFQI